MEIRLPKPLAIVLVICCLALSSFFLLFGAANWLHPDVPADYLAAHPWRNTVACVVVVAIGLFFDLLAFVTIRRTFLRRSV